MEKIKNLQALRVMKNMARGAVLGAGDGRGAIVTLVTKEKSGKKLASGKS